MYINAVRYKVGPKTRYKWDYNSTCRGYNPSYLFIFGHLQGFITPFITGRGPPCRDHVGDRPVLTTM